MPTFVSRDALDQLLLERFGGKVGRSLPVELSRRRQSPNVRRFRSAPVLTGCNGHTEKDESFAETGHNAGTNISLR
jgi:hypothetical protein